MFSNPFVFWDLKWPCDEESPSIIIITLCVYSVAKTCPTPCNPMDCSPPGSTVHGISQARILQWVAISFSREYTNSAGSTGLTLECPHQLLPCSGIASVFLFLTQICFLIVMELQHFLFSSFCSFISPSFIQWTCILYAIKHPIKVILLKGE